MLGVILGIVIFALLFPKAFAFFKGIFMFFWNILGNIVMFFVNLFSGVGSNILGPGVTGLIEGLGKVTAPIERMMTGSVIVPIIVLVVLGGLYFALDQSHFNLDAKSFDFGLKMNYAWCFSAINLGMIIAGSGHPMRHLCGVIDSYFTDYAITLSNFSQWSAFAKGMLFTTLIGGMIAAILFGCMAGILSFVRSWIGYGFCGVLGYLFMLARLSIFGWLMESLGFIGSLLNIVMVLVETFVIIQFFFGIVVFLMPSGMIAATNQQRRERERRAFAKPVSFDDDDDDGGFAPPKSVFPQTLTIGGEQYRLKHDSGDHAEYYCPRTGAIKQVWDVDLTAD